MPRMQRSSRNRFCENNAASVAHAADVGLRTKLVPLLAKVVVDGRCRPPRAALSLLYATVATYIQWALVVPLMLSGARRRRRCRPHPMYPMYIKHKLTRAAVPVRGSPSSTHARCQMRAGAHN